MKCNHRYDEVNINKIASVFGLNEACLKSLKFFVDSQKMNQQGFVGSGDTSGPMFGGPIENVTVSGILLVVFTMVVTRMMVVLSRIVNDRDLTQVDVGEDAVLECRVNNLGDYLVRSVSGLVTSDDGRLVILVMVMSILVLRMVMLLTTALYTGGLV